VLYKREGREETFTGSVRREGVTDITFAGATFNQILEFASDALKRAPECRLVMKREEAPYPMVMPTGFDELLRTDLPAAIEALTVLPRQVQVGVHKQRVYTGLRHGFDTLADALGDEVYIRMRMAAAGVEVEDPLTGRWKSMLARDSATSVCGNLIVSLASRGWVAVNTEHLLAQSAGRYYLPRRWNPSESWITHDLLTYMYDVYRKEKAECSPVGA
jgi:hypothetical protein